MRISCIAILIFLSLPVPMNAAVVRDPEFCNRLKSFERAPFTKGSDGKPIRRFIEFQWSDSWLTGGSWGCRNTPEPVAKSFCSYLMGHTNQEFSAALPMRILTCHGYGFPTYSSDWSGWTADIHLRAAPADRTLDLDVYLVHGTVDAVMRLSSIPLDASDDDKEPPPLKNTPSVATTAP